MGYHFKRSGEVMDQLFDKAETALQEHQQLKTINGESLTGHGDIIIKIGSDDYVKYVPQELTEAQKLQARINLGIDELILDTITNILTTPV